MTPLEHAATKVGTKANVPVPIIVAIITAVSQIVILCLQREEPDTPPEVAVARMARRRPIRVHRAIIREGRKQGLTLKQARAVAVEIKAGLKDKELVRQVLSERTRPRLLGNTSEILG